MFFLLLSLFLFCSAYGEPAVVLKINDKKVSFDQTPLGSLDRLCVKRLGCEALKRLKKAAKSEKPTLALSGGKHPEAVYCVEKLGGAMVTGFDPLGKSVGICKFSDSSYVTFSSLGRYFNY
jgi:hypothetical protein